MVWLSTEANDQSSLHCVIVSTDVMSDHSGCRHASREALKQFFSELHTHLQAVDVDAHTSAVCPGKVAVIWAMFVYYSASQFNQLEEKCKKKQK